MFPGPGGEASLAVRMPIKPHPPARESHHGLTVALAVFLVLLAVIVVGIEVALPAWIRHRINENAGENGGYGWTVKNVAVHILQGSYELQGVTLRQKEMPVTPFTADRITSTLRQKRLFRTPITEEVEAFGPALDIGLDPGPNATRPISRPDWRPLLHRLTLFRLSRFAIHQGETHFQDPHANPKVEISVHDLEIRAENLFRGGEDSARWAGMEAAGRLGKSGSFRFRIRLQPEAAAPTFKLDFSLPGLELKTMNSALRAYADIAVKSGRLDLEVHANAAGGGYTGTVQSELHDFAIQENAEAQKDKGFVKTVERKIAKVAGKILEKKTERNEAKGGTSPQSDFSGRFPAGAKDAWSMSEYLLREAFRKGMSP